MDHLSEEQIQDYLDQPRKHRSVEIGNHLRTCETCRRNVASYRHVYASLKQEPEFTLPANLIERVTKKIEMIENKKYKKWESILLIFTIIQAVIVSIYFVNFSSLIDQFLNKSSGILQSLHEKIGFLNHEFIPILIIAVVILSFYGMLEWFIDQRKQYQSS